jgi:ATP-dependent exoDNAse (exonuclease V) alpha subunit
MAIFHLKIDPIKRSLGQKATAAAAYRAGERIHDHRTGTVHDHSRRSDVTYKEIFLPSQLNASAMEWARDRATLWNTAEQAEGRRTSRVAREFQVTLPSELAPDRRQALARTFARELADRYGVAIDLAIHDPKPGGDPRNFHAHLLATTREVTPEGLGQKAGLDMQAVRRASLGLPDHSEEYTAVRERWAVLANEALRDVGIEERIDHRSLAAQGLDRQPVVHVPMEFYRWKGVDSETLSRIREDYRARVAARREHSHQTAQQPEVDPRNIEEVRRRAAQAWLEMRSKGGSMEKEDTQAPARHQRSKDMEYEP